MSRSPFGTTRVTAPVCVTSMSISLSLLRLLCGPFGVPARLVFHQRPPRPAFTREVEAEFVGEALSDVEPQAVLVDLVQVWLVIERRIKRLAEVLHVDDHAVLP